MRTKFTEIRLTMVTPPSVSARIAPRVRPKALMSPIVTTLRDTPMALLRFNYRLMRIPLQLVEDVASTELDEQAPTRLAYEQLLIQYDRVAGHFLNDEDAQDRAAELHRHTVAVRAVIARDHQRVDTESAALLDLQRARFHQRRTGTDPA